MAPLVRRSWAPSGEQPEFFQKGAGNRGREKVSVAATYAPMLNPIEPLWSWMKYSQLSNFPPDDEWQMNDVATGLLEIAKHDQAILDGIFDASELPRPVPLLF